jgi:hypothetical protein
MEPTMQRLLFAGALFATMLGMAEWAGAQPYPAQQADPPMAYRIVRIIPNPPPDTARGDVAVTPGCGAANPQGGIPTSVTWGQCP